MYSFSIEKSMELSLYEIDYFMNGKLYCDSFDMSVSSLEKKKIKLEHQKSYYIGVEEECGRGFEIYILENTIEFLVNSPATLQDWESALNFMSKIAIRENSLIRDIEGNSYTYESILDFDYHKDIENALHDLYKILCVDKINEFTNILGMRYSQLIDAKILQSFFDSEDLLESFSNFIRDNQWIDYETTEQRFYEHKETRDMISFYYIVVNEPTIIPLQPIIEIAYDMQNITHEDIAKYMIMFIDEDINVIGEFNHCHLEELLPKDKYKVLDAKNVAIEALSIEEMKELSRKSKAKDGE